MSGISPTDIIREVKCRPALYNINLKEYKQTSHKQKLWLEVAEVLTPAEDWEEFTDEDKKARIDLIHTKWKNLRDHFHRVLKAREDEGDTQKPKYKHFDDMEFMRPFVGFKPPINRKITKLESVELVDESIANVTDFDMEALLNTNDEDDEIETPNKRPKRIVKPTPKAVQNKISTPPNNKNAKDAVIKNFDGLRKATVSKESAFPSQSPSFKIRDGDISFCLSIVPNLRKLGDSKKLRAKIDILKVLQKYNDEYEKSLFLKRSVASKKKRNNTSLREVEDMEDTDMQEDHLEDPDNVGNVVNVKNEHYVDPLNDNGNTKTWWT